MSLKKRYDALLPLRDPFMDRAQEASKYTLPHLMPRDGHSKSSKLPTPYQSVGARGVSNLAAKLLIALFPPGHPFFKLDVDKFTIDKISEDEQARAEFDKALSDVEQSVMSHVESSPLRTSAFETLKHLIATGNGLMYKPPGSKRGDIRFYDLSKYVVKRDASGNVLEGVLKESISPSMVSEEVRRACDCEDMNADTKNVDLYTGFKYEDGKCVVTQEINDKAVPDAKDEYPEDKSPWIVLRMQKVDGEDYGRGYVEEYLGDLISLEGLTKAIVKGSAAAAKVVFLVNPNGTTKATDLNKAQSGDFKTGRADDVTSLGLDKFADFRVAKDTIDMIERRVAQGFLLNSAVQRDAERVTAAEVQYMAQELDDALGGIYSILAQEFQLPLVRRYMQDLMNQKKLPELPEELVNPVIVTGMDALGRTADLAKLDTLVGDIFSLSPEIASQYIDLSNYIKRKGAYLRIDTEGLIRTQQQVDQANQKAQMQQMLQEMGPQMMQGVMEQQKGNK